MKPCREGIETVVRWAGWGKQDEPGSDRPGDSSMKRGWRGPFAVTTHSPLQHWHPFPLSFGFVPFVLLPLDGKYVSVTFHLVLEPVNEMMATHLEKPPKLKTTPKKIKNGFTFSFPTI